MKWSFIVIYCYNIIPVQNIMTEYRNREFHVESLQVAHKINWMGSEDAENRTRNQWFAVGLIEISVKSACNDSYFGCFYIPLLFLVPCILVAFFSFFFVRNKQKESEDKWSCYYICSSWMYCFFKENLRRQGEKVIQENFERLICSQMLLNSWLLIPLSFSSLLICSLILDF